MADEQLAMFGHHPDPIIDYGVEIECLEGRVYNIKVGFDRDFEEVLRALDKAVWFRAATLEGLALKEQARRLDAEFKAYVASLS